MLQQVRNIHSKNYLNEAIASYRVGAYRASLITTWIAVCVDIIEKVRELSLAEDPAAKKIEQRLDNIDPNDSNAMLSFERSLLDIACEDLQLISTIEKSHLERLKNDRNVCAHPTFSEDGNQFSPQAELSLSYIAQAANYLLVHPPVKGKVVIKRLFELINEPSFPTDEEKAFTLLSSENNLGRVRESSVRNLTVILLKRVFRDEASFSPTLLFQITAALGAISRLYPNIYQAVIESKLGQMLSEATDNQLKRVFPFLTARNDMWNKIDRAEKVRIDGLIETMSVDDLVKYMLGTLAEINFDIRDKFVEVAVALDASGKSKLMSGLPTTVLKQQAIALFSDARSYDSAESLGINIVLPLSECFDENDLERIFLGSLENTGSHGVNQIINARSIGHFFSQLYAETKAAQVNHQRIWKGFHDRLSERNKSYLSLNELMIEDGLLATPAVEDDDEIPF
jgi:hypothetical protein